MNLLPKEPLELVLASSELGREWMNKPLINQDIWALTDLSYSPEECGINSTRNLYFDRFSLPWLKLLAKLTVLFSVREKFSLGNVSKKVRILKNLDDFLVDRGYHQPQDLTDSKLREFIAESNSVNRQPVVNSVVKLWREEGWLIFSYTQNKDKKAEPKIETIPEEVLYQIYQKFDLFPATLERLFRLQLVLGCRIGEMLRIPRQCLKRENDQWFLLKWVQKRKHWQFYQVHPKVAELIREQQKFLDAVFGADDNFDKLFCKTSVASMDGADAGSRFQVEPVYLPEIISNAVIYHWLKDFSEVADLKDKHGKRFHLTSHMFRRTKASIMAYAETEDEYIAAVLGHGSLDMLNHYRQRSLSRLEKEAQTKGYVDMYGRVTSFTPRKRRYEKLAEIIKVSTPLGECHRPTMLGDCQHRYACLSCDHHRVTLSDKSELLADYNRLQNDRKQAETLGQSRRVTEINRLLDLLENRLKGLSKIENIKLDKDYAEESSLH